MVCHVVISALYSPRCAIPGVCLVTAGILGSTLWAGAAVHKADVCFRPSLLVSLKSLVSLVRMNCDGCDEATGCCQAAFSRIFVLQLSYLLPLLAANTLYICPGSLVLALRACWEGGAGSARTPFVPVNSCVTLQMGFCRSHCGLMPCCFRDFN